MCVKHTLQSMSAEKLYILLKLMDKCDWGLNLNYGRAIKHALVAFVREK